MHPFAQDLFVRPLLMNTREELETYARLRSVPAVEDPTNTSDEFLRNRFRNDVIPALEKIQPGVGLVIARSALVMGDDALAVRQLADERLEGMAVWTEGTVTLPIAILSFGPLRRLLLHRICERLLEYPPDSRHIARAAAFLDDEAGSATMELPDGVLLEREYGQVTLRIGPLTRSPGFDLPVTCPGRVDLPGGVLLVNQLARWDGRLPQGEAVALIGQAEGLLPLRVRSRQRGDRMEPLGMAGSRKLSDLLIDCRVPRARRNLVPVVTDGSGRILWVAGVRRSAIAPACVGSPAWELRWQEEVNQI